MTKVEAHERRKINYIHHGELTVVELRNVGNNNPWGRFFTEAAIDEALQSGTLEDVWNLTSNSQATHRSSWDHPYTPMHLRLMCQNVEFLERGEPLWRFYRYRTSPRWQSWGICRIVDGVAHYPGGRTEELYV
ncbi:MAG: hypothetical protein HY231_23615 [Acidobacteria bacterium]|nr:hypothetical protein [Acidobacteriota bacterium]